MTVTAPPCLPPREVTRPKTPPPPDARDTHAHVFAGHLFELFQQWTPQQRILVANPARLHDFPN
jgi:hypothetical protein